MPPGPKQENGVFYKIDPNFKPQYFIQANLSVARGIGRALSLEIEYQMYRSVHAQQNQKDNYVRNYFTIFGQRIYNPDKGCPYLPDLLQQQLWG
jgi:hypothetical protein